MRKYISKFTKLAIPLVLTAIVLLSAVSVDVGFEDSALADRGNPTGISWIQQWSMATGWDADGHSQGACVDSTGTYLYWSSGNRLTKTLVSSPDWISPLAENTNAMNDGTDVDQINGIREKDGYIYASAPIFATTPYRFFVKVYDADTLEYVEEHELTWTSGGDTQEGIEYYDGYWYAVKFNNATVDVYADTDWSYQGSESLPGQPLQIQGAAWISGQFWVSTTSEPIRVYDWDGSDFTLYTTFTHPAQVLSGQSYGATPDGNYLYMADISASYEYLHKISISWEVKE